MKMKEEGKESDPISRSHTQTGSFACGRMGTRGCTIIGCCELVTCWYWQGIIEEMYEMGWCRAIGVSDLDVRHLKQLQEDGTKIMPMVNQIEAIVEV